MHATKMFKGMIVGVMVFILALVFSLKEATAATQAELCVLQANIVTTIANLRDQGIAQHIVLTTLVAELNFSYGDALTTTNGIWESKKTPTELGNWMFKSCMGEGA